MIEASVEVKIKLIGSMFPEKIEFDGKEYRTKNYNKVLDLIFQETKQLRGEEKEKGESVLTFPNSVPISVPFSNPQFLRDLDMLWELRHYIPNPKELVYTM